MTNRQKVANVAVVIVVSILCASNFDAARAQLFGPGPIAELQTEVERLQRDIRDLQMEVFRNGNTGAPTGAAMSAQRVDDIEQSLRRLTGDMEGLMFEINQLSQRMERLQSQLEFLERNQSAPDLLTGLPQDPALGDEPLSGEQPLSETPDGQSQNLALAPSEGILGTLPQSAPPAPGAGGQANVESPNTISPPLAGDPEAEFEAAMGLLTRAQYGTAKEAFRTFSTNHPDTELGAQALYWTADIAYSVDRDYQGAARDFAELLRQYPDTPRAPEGMLKLGLSLLALGQLQEGCITLAALPRTYPNATASITDRARDERSNAACA